jgi:ATP-dependent Lon protease
MSSRTVGLVGMWDVVAFDEVAGIKMKDKDGIQIMTGFMANGSFSRGKESFTKWPIKSPALIRSMML